MNDDSRVNVLSTESESLSKYLKKRERELIQQTAAIRGMLIPKEKELDQVRKAMRAIGILPSRADELAPFLVEGEKETQAPNSPTVVNIPAQLIINGTPVNLTIKDMILAAMKDHFHSGASPAELRDYFKAVYGRDIDRASISPQLARLRDSGLLEQSPEGFWRARRSIKDLSVQALLDNFPHGATVDELGSYIRLSYGRDIPPGSLRTQLHRLKASGVLGHESVTDTWNFQDGKRSLYARYDHPTSRQNDAHLQDEPEVSLTDVVAKMPWEQGGDK